MSAEHLTPEHPVYKAAMNEHDAALQAVSEAESVVKQARELLIGAEARALLAQDVLKRLDAMANPGCSLCGKERHK